MRIEYTVVNAGNVRLTANVDTALAGPFGLNAVTATSDQGEILPGASSSANTRVKVWPLLSAWGDIAISPKIVGDDRANSPTEVRVTSFTVWTIPWSQLLVIALIVGVSFLFVALRRQALRRVQIRIDSAVAAANRPAATAQDALETE